MIAVDTKPNDTDGVLLRTPLKNKFQFPFKLHQLLDDAAKEGNEHIVSWLPHGKAFKVHSKKEFENEILPRYYSATTKYRSFSRQLSIYGFKRMKEGSSNTTSCAAKDHGAYCHPLMSRGNQELCKLMVREKIKNDRSASGISTNAAQKIQGLRQQQQHGLHSPAFVPHYEASHRVLHQQEHYNCATNCPQVPIAISRLPPSNTMAALEQAMPTCLMPLQEQEGTADAGDGLLEFAIEANVYLDAAELHKRTTGCLPASAQKQGGNDDASPSSEKPGTDFSFRMYPTTAAPWTSEQDFFTLFDHEELDVKGETEILNRLECLLPTMCSTLVLPQAKPERHVNLIA